MNYISLKEWASAPGIIYLPLKGEQRPRTAKRSGGLGHRQE